MSRIAAFSVRRRILVIACFLIAITFAYKPVLSVDSVDDIATSEVADSDPAIPEPHEGTAMELYEKPSRADISLLPRNPKFIPTGVCQTVTIGGCSGSNTFVNGDYSYYITSDYGPIYRRFMASSQSYIYIYYDPSDYTWNVANMMWSMTPYIFVYSTAYQPVGITGWAVSSTGRYVTDNYVYVSCQATCATFTCPSGYTLKSSSIVCSGSCNTATCCTAICQTVTIGGRVGSNTIVNGDFGYYGTSNSRPYYRRFIASSQSYVYLYYDASGGAWCVHSVLWSTSVYMYAMSNAYDPVGITGWQVSITGGFATDSNVYASCLVTCATFSCPSGYTSKSSSTVCGGSCNTATCCTVTCATFTCPSGYTPKSSSTVCSGSCDTATCCTAICQTVTIGGRVGSNTIVNGGFSYYGTSNSRPYYRRFIASSQSYIYLYYEPRVGAWDVSNVLWSTSVYMYALSTASEPVGITGWKVSLAVGFETDYNVYASCLVTCATFSCPSGYTSKSSSTVCSGSCNTATCCAAMTVCQTLTIGGRVGTNAGVNGGFNYNGTSDFWPYYRRSIAGQSDLYLYYDPNDGSWNVGYTLWSTSVIMYVISAAFDPIGVTGWKIYDVSWGTFIEDYHIYVSCQVTCATFTCPSGYVLKSSSTACSGSCDIGTCCRATCQNFDCGPYLLRPASASTPCSGLACTRADCCYETCSSSGVCGYPYGLNQLMINSECTSFNCSRTICCVPMCAFSVCTTGGNRLVPKGRMREITCKASCDIPTCCDDAPDSATEFQIGVGYPGNDINVTNNVIKAASCSQLCSENSRCSAWDWTVSSLTCRMKSIMSNPVNQTTDSYNYSVSGKKAFCGNETAVPCLDAGYAPKAGRIACPKGVCTRDICCSVTCSAAQFASLCGSGYQLKTTAGSVRCENGCTTEQCCEPICEFPKNTIGIDSSKCTSLLRAADCQLACLTGYLGSVSVVCARPYANFTISGGCRPKCKFQSVKLAQGALDQLAYNVTKCPNFQGDTTIDECSLTCAPGYLVDGNSEANSTSVSLNSCTQPYGGFTYSLCRTPKCNVTVGKDFRPIGYISPAVQRGLGHHACCDFCGKSANCTGWAWSATDRSCYLMTNQALNSRIDLNFVSGAVKKASCTKFECPSNLRLKANFTNITCESFDCRQDECCDVLCSLGTPYANNNTYIFDGCPSGLIGSCALKCNPAKFSGNLQSKCSTPGGNFVISGVCEPKCLPPVQNGLVIVPGCSSARTARDCLLSCAGNYSGTPTPVCSAAQPTFTIQNGCEPICQLPTVLPMGLAAGNCAQPTTERRCTLSCASGFVGSPSSPTAKCPGAGLTFVISGNCVPLCTSPDSTSNPLCNSCSLPKVLPSYANTTLCNGSSVAVWQCKLTCSIGSFGNLSALCKVPGGIFEISGTCVATRTCSGFACPSGTGLKSSPGLITCRQTTCVASECCETTCSTPGTFLVSGNCTAFCTMPISTAYDLSRCYGLISAASCSLSCVPPFVAVGTPTAVCNSPGGLFSIKNPCVPQCALNVNECYNTQGCRGLQTAQNCKLTCAEGFSGNPVVTCPAEGGSFVIGGVPCTDSCAKFSCGTGRGLKPNATKLTCNRRCKQSDCCDDWRFIDCYAENCIPSGWRQMTMAEALILGDELLLQLGATQVGGVIGGKIVGQGLRNGDSPVGYQVMQDYPRPAKPNLTKLLIVSASSMCTGSMRVEKFVSSCLLDAATIALASCPLSCAADTTGKAEVTCYADRIAVSGFCAGADLPCQDASDYGTASETDWAFLPAFCSPMGSLTQAFAAPLKLLNISSRVGVDVEGVRQQMEKIDSSVNAMAQTAGVRPSVKVGLGACSGKAIQIITRLCSTVMGSKVEAGFSYMRWGNGTSQWILLIHSTQLEIPFISGLPVDFEDTLVGVGYNVSGVMFPAPFQPVSSLFLGGPRLTVFLAATVLFDFFQRNVRLLFAGIWSPGSIQLLAGLGSPIPLVNGVVWLEDVIGYLNYSSSYGYRFNASSNGSLSNSSSYKAFGFAATFVVPQISLRMQVQLARRPSETSFAGILSFKKIEFGPVRIPLRALQAGFTVRDKECRTTTGCSAAQFDGQRALTGYVGGIFDFSGSALDAAILFNKTESAWKVDFQLRTAPNIAACQGLTLKKILLEVFNYSTAGLESKPIFGPIFSAFLETGIRNVYFYMPIASSAQRGATVFCGTIDFFCGRSVALLSLGLRFFTWTDDISGGRKWSLQIQLSPGSFSKLASSFGSFFQTAIDALGLDSLTPSFYFGDSFSLEGLG